MHAWKTMILLIATLAIPLAAAADCPENYQVLGDEGSAWLGMNAGGFIAGEGQSFMLECTCLVETVRFELILDGQTWYGVPPLGTGDILYGEIKTPYGVTLASKSVVLDFDVGRQWIAFDFSGDNISLGSGEYLLTCYPASPKQGRMAYHQAEDIYADGIRYISSNGGAGPWTPASPENGDLAFKVNPQGYVPTNLHTWGSVKSLYH